MQEEKPNNNAIIKYQSALLTKVSKHLTLTNKLLVKQDDQKFIDFFIKNHTCPNK